MSGWLKFLGIVQIAIGIPALAGLVGALYIWLGVLLLQAGNAAQSNQPHKLIEVMDKLKTFFLVSGILAALGILTFLVVILTIGGGLLTLFSQL